MPTVSDVARLAGVSPMTVSRVINSLPNVESVTRAKVQAAIAELGYVPNTAARSLAGRRPCRIALLHSNPSAAYLSEFLVGSLAGAAEVDAQLVVEHWDGEQDREELVRRLGAHRIDAVLLPPPLCDDHALLTALGAARLKAAQIASGSPVRGIRSVNISDEAAAHAMAGYLIALGHTRIGFIAGDPNQTASALRRRGYERAMREAGLPTQADWIEQGDFSYRSGLAATGRLLGLDPRPTAIFASNDDMAAAAIAAAHRNGLSVPQDISVAGFDDTAMARTVWPEITTIRQPVAEMARRAAMALSNDVRLPRQDSETCWETLDFELVERESVARLSD